MSVSTSQAAYNDCYEVLDQAISDQKGIRVRMETYDKAIYFRLRCHTARRLNREFNSRAFPPDDPKHSTSQYDNLTLRIKTHGENVYLYFERNDALVLEVESLSDGVDLTPAEEPEDDFASTPVAVEPGTIERIRRI